MVLTRNINAKRLARMVTTPVIAGVSTMLYDFRSDSQQYSMNFPSLKGQLFKNIPFMFDNATILGIFPANSDQLIMNVSPGYVMQVCSMNVRVMSPALICMYLFTTLPYHMHIGNSTNYLGIAVAILLILYLMVAPKSVRCKKLTCR